MDAGSWGKEDMTLQEERNTVEKAKYTQRQNFWKSRHCNKEAEDADMFHYKLLESGKRDYRCFL